MHLKLNYTDDGMSIEVEMVRLSARDAEERAGLGREGERETQV